MGRVRVYFKFWNDNGTGHDADWTEVTEDVSAKGISSIKLQLDRNEYGVGTYRPANNTVRMRNVEGKYSDVGTEQSVFRFRRAGTLVRFAWDQATYVPTPMVAPPGPTGALISDEVDLFIGSLDDLSAVTEQRKQEIKFKVLGRESVFSRVQVPFGDLSNGDNISDIFFDILNQDEIKALLTVDASNIVPGYDAVVDDVSDYENKTVKEVLDDLLLVSNSVLYVNGDEIKIVARTAGASVDFSFYGPGSSLGPENLLAMFDIRNGLNRVLNYLTWRDTSLLAEDATSVQANGTFKKEIDVSGITTTGTRQTILNTIRDAYSTKKQELKVTTPMTYDSIALAILGRVDIDSPAPVFSTDDLPYYGIAEYGVAKYPNQMFSYTLDQSTNFMVIGKTIDPLKEVVSFQLREI